MIPKHVAVIMDGNRRWAKERHLSIAIGYQRGVVALKRTVRAASHAGIGVLSAFAFSDENWSRPSGEVEILMNLCAFAARGELRSLARENVRIRICGRKDRLPHNTLAALDDLVAETAQNDGITLNLAIDYGGRHEIGDALRALISDVSAGLREVGSIDETAIRSKLYTAGLPDPDLIVRTGGELRISNFLLFQSAYAEFWATNTNWPDFGEAHLQSALDAFSARQRRYGT